MAQNIYDKADFYNNYAQLARSKHGLVAAPEWPAIEAMLPPLAGKDVADLGCGYGWFCRHAREAGARQVLGLDLSEKMLARAQELTSDSAISYLLADLESLSLEPDSLDLAYSQLAMHYLPELKTIFATIFQALRPGACLVFSQEHPIYTCTSTQTWLCDEAGQRYWGVNNYQKEGARVSNWLAEGVIKYHRTLGTTLNTLLATGFAIREVNEWGPSEQQIQAFPALAEEAERPMMVIISAQRPLG